MSGYQLSGEAATRCPLYLIYATKQRLKAEQKKQMSPAAVVDAFKKNVIVLIDSLFMLCITCFIKQIQIPNPL